MPTYANILPAPPKDGIVYCQNTLLPASESDLGTPINLLWHTAIAATVALNAVVTGSSSSSSSKRSSSSGAAVGNAYVVMQTDNNDENWIDLAWITTGLVGNLDFFLSGGMDGANAIYESRQSGSAPVSNGSNQTPLGARVRFVAKGPAGSTVTIKYRLVPLR